MSTPKLAVFQLQLIINKRLLDNQTISEQQYNEVNKIIYEKMRKCKEKLSQA